MLNKVYSNARRSPPLAPESSTRENLSDDTYNRFRSVANKLSMCSQNMGEAFLGLSFEQLGLIPSGND